MRRAICSDAWEEAGLATAMNNQEPVTAYLERAAADKFQQTTGGTAVLAATDVFVCDAPGFQCLLLLPLLADTKVMVVRFSHRFTHALSPHSAAGCAAGMVSAQRAALAALRTFEQHPRVVLATASAYDYMFMLHHTGTKPTPPCLFVRSHTHTLSLCVTFSRVSRPTEALQLLPPVGRYVSKGATKGDRRAICPEGI